MPSVCYSYAIANLYFVIQPAMLLKTNSWCITFSCGNASWKLFIYLYTFMCISMSAGVCWVPLYYKCEPTQPILQRAWPIHVTTIRLVQSEGFMDRQDSRGAAGETKDLWPKCADITDWGIFTINVKFDCYHLVMTNMILPSTYKSVLISTDVSLFFSTSTSFPAHCHFKSLLWSKSIKTFSPIVRTIAFEYIWLVF